MTVSAQHLYKSIGKQPILKDLSFSISEGEIVGLLGPNGAGKSTLMKLLTAQWSFNSGELQVCGNVAQKGSLPHQTVKHVGYLAENNPLYVDMYVREFLMFMADIQGLDRASALQKTNELIELVNLKEMAHKKIKELSKGYKQRVGLAQALIGDPELLILDEPTTGFDQNQLDESRALIKRLGENRTIILSTHILQEVKAMCSRVIIIAGGEIKADINDLNNIDLEQLFREKTHG